MDARRVRAPELDRVPDEVLEHLAQLHRVADHRRQGSRVTSAPCSAIVTLRFTSTRSRMAPQSAGANSVPALPTREYASRSLMSARIRVAPSTAYAMNSSASASSLPL